MKARLLATLLAAATLSAAPAFAHGGMMETSIHDNASFAQAPAEFKVEFEHESAITNLMLMTADKKMIALDFKPSKTMGQGLHDPTADARDRQLHPVVEIDGQGRSRHAGRCALHRDRQVTRRWGTHCHLPCSLIGSG